ncbi:LptF/LptG family permease [Sulfurimonas microaerophilic]|uniref:LptF/LptG family permease n=1 Tax=Sulfurimonas microaerophilic TaxID=3058392 RepID=UPI0027146F8A|nr:LptF/LptG family permease [Sulfurimonas sp. hsl 1-7]
MLAYKYIALHYLKYFSVILLALVLFMVGFDYMGNADALSKSANLVLIYLVYKTFFAIDMLLPISLVFGMIATKIYLIRSNALVSLYSLGYSRVDALKPFVVVASLIIFLFISLHAFTKFSRAQEYAYNIRVHGKYLNPSRDLFFIHKGQYIYFSKLLPIQEKALGIRVFEVNNGSLKSILTAKEARYEDNFWRIKDADVITKPDDLSFGSTGISVTEEKDLKILEEFRPKMLDQVYLGQVDFTISDAFEAYKLLSSQGVETSNIRGALYRIFIYPFFAPILIVIIFFLVPISVRFLNVSLFSFGAILSTLLVWGLLFMLIELSNHKTISSEVGLIGPISILLFIALWLWKKHRLST